MLVQERIIISIIALAAIIVDPAFAFSMSKSRPCHIAARHFTTSTKTICAPVNLHPDQASELEAAATELMKSQQAKEEDSDNNDDENAKEERIDDTNKHTSSPLSAASSAAQPAKKWWSTTFASMRRRSGSN